MDEKPSLSLLNTTVLILFPAIALIGAPLYIYHQGWHWADLAICFGLVVVVGLSITAGYHRYFSHRTYECHKLVQFFYLVFGAAALQNTALEWSSQHRIHHKEVDKPKDPYNAQKGFWWSHMGWVFYDTDVDPNYLAVPDLKKNRLVMWQHRNYILLAALAGFALPTMIGALYGRPLGGLLIGGFLRSVLTHHSTFLINSAAHYVGSQTYTDKNSARDAWWLALFTFGEGYHNYHHMFKGDYRNGIRHYHWDPTKWLIKGLSYVGLTWKLRKTSELAIARARLKMETKKSQALLETLPQSLAMTMNERCETLRKRIDEAAFELTRLRQKHSAWLQASNEIQRVELRRLKAQWRAQLQERTRACRDAWREYGTWMQELQLCAVA